MKNRFGKEFLTQGLEVVKKVVNSRVGKGLIVGTGLVVIARTPVGKKFIGKSIEIVTSSNLGKKTTKEVAKNRVNETAKEVAEKAATEILANYGGGTPKSPHIRSGHPRKLASGVIIQVSEAIIHKDKFV